MVPVDWAPIPSSRVFAAASCFGSLGRKENGEKLVL